MSVGVVGLSPLACRLVAGDGGVACPTCEGTLERGGQRWPCINNHMHIMVFFSVRFTNIMMMIGRKALHERVAVGSSSTPPALVVIQGARCNLPPRAVVALGPSWNLAAQPGRGKSRD